jgi:hypothetical protein
MTAIASKYDISIEIKCDAVITVKIDVTFKKNTHTHTHTHTHTREDRKVKARIGIRNTITVFHLLHDSTGRLFFLFQTRDQLGPTTVRSAYLAAMNHCDYEGIPHSSGRFML